MDSLRRIKILHTESLRRISSLHNDSLRRIKILHSYSLPRIRTDLFLSITILRTIESLTVVGLMTRYGVLGFCITWELVCYSVSEFCILSRCYMVLDVWTLSHDSTLEITRFPVLEICSGIVSLRRVYQNFAHWLVTTRHHQDCAQWLTNG